MGKHVLPGKRKTKYQKQVCSKTKVNNMSNLFLLARSAYFKEIVTTPKGKLAAMWLIPPVTVWNL